MAKVTKKSKSKNRFKGSVGRNAAKQTRGAQYGHLNLPKGVSIYKAEAKSRVNLDIMPYVVSSKNHPDRDDEYKIAIPGGLWYKLPYWLHRNIGANKDSVVCPSSIGQKCPICEYRKQLLKDGAMWDDDTVKALKPSMRNLYVVIPKGSKEYPETPHIWDISQFLFQEKMNEEISENDQYETFPDLEYGYTLRVRFTENQLGVNKFAETSRIDFIDREETYEESILEEIPTLDEILIVPSFKVVETMFFGGISQDEIEDDEDDKKTKTKAKRVRPSTKIDEDEEDDEEDEEDDIEEDDIEEDDIEEDDIEEDDIEEDEEDDIDDDDDEIEVRKPSKTTKTKSSVKTKSTSPTKTKAKTTPAKNPTKKRKENQCPYGHVFGTDCEEHDDCEECDKWECCIDAEEK